MENGDTAADQQAFSLVIGATKLEEAEELPELWCFSVSDNKLLIRLLADRFFSSHTSSFSLMVDHFYRDVCKECSLYMQR